MSLKTCVTFACTLLQLLRLQLQLVLLFVHVANLLLKALEFTFKGVPLLNDLTQFLCLALTSLAHFSSDTIFGIKESMDRLDTQLDLVRVS